MNKYTFSTHYGKSTVTDNETGVIVEWENGRFNDTNTAKIDPTAVLPTDPGELAETLARTCREIADHVLENYPELV